MKKITLTLLSLLMTGGTLMAQTRVIAHRGFWNKDGAAMNSVEALRNAYDAGVYGSEFDVHVTKDNVVVVNHDDDIHGVIIEDAEYAQIKDLKLSNGETIPTLRQYLEAGKRLGDMRMVLEIKAHETAEKEDRCVAEAVKEVREAGLESRTDYISFSLHACEQVLKVAPEARVYYLNGDLTPDEVKAKGFAGIDYEGSVYLKHPEWIARTHELGMKVNVWTIDEVKQMQMCVDYGVDYITTNKPVEAMRIAAGELSVK